jgi:hypothetical protein
MATSRVFYGWWVTPAFATMVFFSAGIRFLVGPFLAPMVADHQAGAAWGSWLAGVLFKATGDDLVA